LEYEERRRGTLDEQLDKLRNVHYHSEEFNCNYFEGVGDFLVY
jgi:hypothetical protein